MDLRDPYIADLIVGRLSWAHVAGEDRLTFDRLVERVVPYAQRYEDVRGSVTIALEDLVEAGLVDAGEPVYGEVGYAIVTMDPAGAEEGDVAWREQAGEVARAIVDREHRAVDADGRVEAIRLEGSPAVDTGALRDAVQILDLLDRAPHR